MTSLFDQLGGETRLRPLIADFVARMMDDTMIGFFFQGVDRQRLTELEYQFTARFMGADIPYDGRPLANAHRRHPIMGGQFDRRRRILEEAMERHGVEPGLQKAWLAHVDALRNVVTRDARGQCIDARGSEPSEEPPSPFRIVRS